MLKNSFRISMLCDKINVAELFRAKSPSLARCKKGYLPLLNFSNLIDMHVASLHPTQPFKSLQLCTVYYEKKES